MLRAFSPNTKHRNCCINSQTNKEHIKQLKNMLLLKPQISCVFVQLGLVFSDHQS